MSAAFTLDDFLKAMDQVRQRFSSGNLSDLIPGLPPESVNCDFEKDIRKLRGIIHAMTPNERCEPDTLTPSRRARIARGCGVNPFDVSDLQRQFSQMRRIMQKMRSLKQR